MYAEILKRPAGNGFDDQRRFERQTDVRSVTVSLSSNQDGDTYPRIGINSPSHHRSVGLREEGPVEIQLFDDDVHEARLRSSVCGPDEAWIQVVVNREYKRALHTVADYCLDGSGLHTIGDVVQRAIEQYLEGVDFGNAPEEVRDGLPDEVYLPEFEELTEEAEEEEGK